MKLHIKKGDQVQVIAGDSKGQQGKVLKVEVSKQRAIVEGVNLVKKATKPNAKNPQETCCDSFVERRGENARNSMGTPSQKIEVDCKAGCCVYNKGCACHADKIDISGVNASTCQQTACQTFVKEN